jgi:hypothetical protein
MSASIDVAEETIRVTCKAKESEKYYDADVPLDITAQEIVQGLSDADYLQALGANERWVVVHSPSGKQVSGTLADVGAEEGDLLILDRHTHGAGG